MDYILNRLAGPTAESHNIGLAIIFGINQQFLNPIEISPFLFLDFLSQGKSYPIDFTMLAILNFILLHYHVKMQYLVCALYIFTSVINYQAYQYQVLHAYFKLIITYRL